MALKTARRIARLTQQQLSLLSGVDCSTISLIENDKRRYGVVAYDDIVRLARALGVEHPQEIFPVPDLQQPEAATS
jgi:transcriptional regulator with XRE-family HTH domain